MEIIACLICVVANVEGINMTISKLIAVLVLFLSFSVNASSVLELMGSSDSVNSFTSRTLSTGAEAAYFNPAYLVMMEDSFRIGYGIMLQSKQINHFAKDSKYDVSSEIYGADQSELTGNGRYVPIATEDLINRRGSSDYDSFDMMITIGAVKSIWKNRLAAGTYIVLPTSGIQTQDPFYNDEREQYFSNSLHYELYGDRLKQFSMAFALGGKVSNFLSLGFGVAVTTYTVTQNRVFVPDGSDPSAQIINAKMKVGGSAAPYFSFVANPLKGLNLTGTFHFPTNTGVVELNNEMQVWNWNYEGDERYLEASSVMTAGYQPIKFSGGIYYDFDFRGYKLTPMGSFEWTRWSTYINRHGETPADKWLDTFSGNWGFHIQNKDRKAAIDFTFIPSPVPKQDGRENYVDNDRFGFSVGYNEYFHFKDFSVGGGISSSVQFLLKRVEEKNLKRSEKDGGIIDEFPDDATNYFDMEGGFPSAQGLQTNNPGFPGWESKGFVLGVGINIEVLY